MLAELFYNFKASFRKLLNGRIIFTPITPQFEKNLDLNIGYDHLVIFENLVSAFKEASNLDQKFERDGILCNHPNYDFYILTNIFDILLKQDTVTVLDIGGGIASKYYQNQKYLSSIKNLTWIVVEQKHIVEYCKKNIFAENLVFQEFDEILIDKINVDVVIVSSAMQYFDTPYDVLSKLINLSPKKIIIDKTPFIKQSNDKKMLQKLPTEMYRAQYICWFFSIDKFKVFLKKQKIVEYEEYNLKMHFYAGEEWKRFILSIGTSSAND